MLIIRAILAYKDCLATCTNWNTKTTHWKNEKQFEIPFELVSRFSHKFKSQTELNKFNQTTENMIFQNIHNIDKCQQEDVSTLIS